MVTYECWECKTPYRKIVHDPPKELPPKQFYGYELLDLTPHDNVVVAYDENGKPYPVWGEPPPRLIHEEWVLDCDCAAKRLSQYQAQEEGYCPECPHCNTHGDE